MVEGTKETGSAQQAFVLDDKRPEPPTPTQVDPDTLEGVQRTIAAGRRWPKPTQTELQSAKPEPKTPPPEPTHRVTAGEVLVLNALPDGNPVRVRIIVPDQQTEKGEEFYKKTNTEPEDYRMMLAEVVGSTFQWPGDRIGKKRPVYTVTRPVTGFAGEKPWDIAIGETVVPRKATAIVSKPKSPSSAA